MQIFIKQFSGRSITLDVDPNEDIVNIAISAYEKRDKAYKNVTIDNYARYIYLVFACRKLEYTKKLSDYGIEEFSTLIEMPRSITMGPSFNWKTLSLIDVVTQEECEDPYSLFPGCGHALGKSSLKTWIETKINAHEIPNCPCCRKDIKKLHLFNLLFWQPSLSTNNNNSTPSANPTSPQNRNSM